MTQLTFGIDKMPVDVPTNGKAKNLNPCIDVYGPGPEGKTCGSCTLLYGKRFAKTYYKCKLRKNTGGPATDHRVRWPACAKWEQV